MEFGGHRNYVPGDDLRWLDRHALLRHGRLLVRQFETETDRALRLVVDATASMGFKSPQAPGAKLAFAAVVAAALARIAMAGGDPVALDWIGGENRTPLPTMGGREAFERVVGALESVTPGGDLHMDSSQIDLALAPVARHARRGAVIVLLSDMVDLPEGTLDRFAALATMGRTTIAVRILDPVEQRFPFDGPLRLMASEGGDVVETDARAAKEGYLAAIESIAQQWDERLVPRGGRLLRACTDDEPVSVVRSVLDAARGLG